MRKLLFGLVGLAALGFGAAGAPAEAQPFYPGGYYGAPRHFSRPAYEPVEYRRPYREYRSHRDYGAYRPYRGYFRPAYMAAPRCYIRPQRVWTHFGWVSRPVRICR